MRFQPVFSWRRSQAAHWAAALSAVAIMASGCGGSDSEPKSEAESKPDDQTTTADVVTPQDRQAQREQPIRQVLAAFLDAVADGDGEQACAKLTDGVKEVVGSNSSVIDSKTGRVVEGGQSCADAMSLFKDLYEPGDIEKVKLKGDRATVKMQFSEPTTIKLERVGDKWRISSFDTAALAFGGGDPALGAAGIE